LGEKTIQLNVVLHASNIENLEFYDVDSGVSGFLDGKVTVTAEVLGVDRISKNNISFFTEDYFRIDSGNKHCFKEIKDVCLITHDVSINKNILIDRPVIVRPGVTLSLKGNANLILARGARFEGTDSSNIIIKGDQSGGIAILNSEGMDNSLINVSVTNLGAVSVPGYRYTGAINVYGGSLKIENLSIEDSASEDQLNVVESEIDINGLKIIDAPSDAFDCDFCNGKIYGFEFSNINGDGLDVSGSDLSVHYLNGINIADKAISVGENSNVDILHASVADSSTAIAVKDGSFSNVKYIELSGVFIDAFMTYVKKPFYSGKASLDVGKLELSTSKINEICVRERNTILKINNEDCKEVDLDVKKLYIGRMRK